MRPRAHKNPSPEADPRQPATEVESSRQPASPLPQIDQHLAELQQRKDSWMMTSLEERLALIERIQQELAPLGPRWVEASVQAKGLQEDRRGRGEEWSIFAISMRTLRILHQSLTDIRDHGRPRLPESLLRRENGQVVAQVFPFSRREALLHRGVTAEVWMQPGETPQEVREGQARAYHNNSKGKVVAVLGAGNVASLITTDVLYKVFVENAVVLLKPNPVNDYLGPILERGLAALIEAGVLRLAYGGAQTGTYLTQHGLVDEIHLTGSVDTFEAILFGEGPEAVQRKRRGDPLLDKRITAELGNVTPVIIVPGPWSQADLEAHANRLAAWFVTNSSFNCLTPRVIIQQADWPLRQPFMEALASALRTVPARKAYYPGAHQHYADCLRINPQAEPCGLAGQGQLPWTLIRDVDPAERTNPCFAQESFCSILAETGLPTDDPISFLEAAADFANETLWGTLTASILIHPRSLRQPKLRQALEGTLEKLRYGMISVNMSVAYAYYVMVAPWGSFPGQPIDDVQSGIGSVNNFLMFDQPQKSVVRGPFHPWPDFLSVNYRHLDQFGERLTRYETHGTLHHIPGLMWTALKP